MKRHYFLYIILLLPFYTPAQILGSNDFEAWDNNHEYTQDSWVTDGFTAPWVSGFDQSRVFIDETVAHSGSKSIKVAYPAGGVGPSETGAQVPLRFNGQSEVYSSYWLYFSDNFDWGGTSEGGKLPGLGSGDNCSGGSTCDGTNGFSARLMWRSGGNAVLYLYHMDKPGTYGEDLPLMKAGNQITFEKGKWYQVAERVKINTNNNYDGEVEVWINGEQALLKTGLRLVNDGSLVDNFYFSTFHGGSGSNWAPSVDCHIWYDDLIISTKESDVFSSICQQADLGEDVEICSYETIELHADLSAENYDLNWYKDGQLLSENDSPLLAENPGEYVVTANNDNCPESKDTIQLIEHNPLLVINDSICEPGSALLAVQAYGDYLWYQHPGDFVPFYEGREYDFNLERDTIFYVAEQITQAYTIGLSEQSGEIWSTSNLDASDKRTKMIVEQTVLLKSFDLFIPNTNNQINVRILDEDESTVLHEIEYTNTTAGKNTVPINIELDPGTYLFDLVGSTKSVDFQAENGVLPYGIPDVVDITCNVDYQCRQGRYGFFYDWKFEVQTVEKCKTPVYGVIDPQLIQCSITADEELEEAENFTITPNPSTGVFYLSKNVEYTVYDEKGRIILSGKSDFVDIQEFSSGIYLIKTKEEIIRVSKH